MSDPSNQTGSGDAHSAPIAVALRYGAQFRPAVMGLILLTALTGGLFPWTLVKLGGAIWPNRAGGDLINSHGVVVGSRLIGQSFTRTDYFQPRPSAAGAGYDGLASGGSNLGSANPKLIDSIRQRALAYRRLNGLDPDTPVPIDAVTSSGSGLDSQISPANAALQIARVARARHMDPALVRRLVTQATQGRQLGFLGEPRVSVLELNLALDRATAPPPG